jgi:hypothetical protein
VTYEDKLRIKAAEAQGWSGPWRFGSTHLHGTPPGAERPATGFMDDEHVPDAVDNIIRELCNNITVLSYGIESIRALANESTGVIGLHQNGDVAPWAELEDGGRFWEWLYAVNDAEHAIEKMKGCKDAT